MITRLQLLREVWSQLPSYLYDKYQLQLINDNRLTVNVTDLMVLSHGDSKVKIRVSLTTVDANRNVTTHTVDISVYEKVYGLFVVVEKQSSDEDVVKIVQSLVELFVKKFEELSSGTKSAVAFADFIRTPT